MPNRPKPKAPKLSKEQIALQMKQRAEAERLRAIAREHVFVPLQGAKSMAHAQQICEILKTVMTSAQNKYWSDKTVKDLGLIEEMSQEGEVLDGDIYKNLLGNLSDISISDAHKLIEGMGGALNGYAAKLARDIKMDTLKAEDIIEA